uniref:Uncharacterized protein n=1 Tax=viral metagenome TaxID=1070528 RepID=A0A6C0I0L3_9ZZZZ
MSANSEINSVSSLEFCQRIVSRLVSDIYYNKQNNSDFLLNKVKSIRSLNDPGNKRLKYILSELISNSDNMLKNFKTIKPSNSSNSSNSSNFIRPPYKKTSKFSTFSTVGNNSSAFEVQNIKVSTPTVHKNKEYLIQALGINKSKKGVLGKSNWVDAESSEDEEANGTEGNEKESDDLVIADDLTMSKSDDLANEEGDVVVNEEGDVVVNEEGDDLANEEGDVVVNEECDVVVNEEGDDLIIADAMASEEGKK